MQYSVAVFFSFRSFVSGVGLLLVHIFTELVRTKVYCLPLFYVVSCAQFNIVHEYGMVERFVALNLNVPTMIQLFDCVWWARIVLFLD